MKAAGQSLICAHSYLNFLAELQPCQGVHSLEGQRTLVVHFPKNVHHDPANGSLCIAIHLYSDVTSFRPL